MADTPQLSARINALVLEALRNGISLDAIITTLVYQTELLSRAAPIADAIREGQRSAP